MKSTKITMQQWHLLRSKLYDDYSRSVMMVRSKMKDVLGFTPREHRMWDNQSGYSYVMYLDWFSEPKRTMFLLKYSEYINGSRN